jgi:hypothetical protein
LNGQQKSADGDSVMISPVQPAGPASESSSAQRRGGDEAFARMLSDLETKIQIQQQQQMQQALQEQYESITANMQRQIQELRSQVHHPKHDQ